MTDGVPKPSATSARPPAADDGELKSQRGIAAVGGSMPRYFFHYRDPNEDLIEDRLGSHHPDLAAVEREAHLLAREMLEEEIARGGPVLATRCLEIADEDGEIVLFLPFWASVSVDAVNSGRRNDVGQRQLSRPVLLN